MDICLLYINLQQFTMLKNIMEQILQFIFSE